MFSKQALGQNCKTLYKMSNPPIPFRDTCPASSLRATQWEESSIAPKPLLTRALPWWLQLAALPNATVPISSCVHPAGSQPPQKKLLRSCTFSPSDSRVSQVLPAGAWEADLGSYLIRALLQLNPSNCQTNLTSLRHFRNPRSQEAWVFRPRVQHLGPEFPKNLNWTTSVS